jgi:hypothetical protein
MQRGKCIINKSNILVCAMHTFFHINDTLMGKTEPGLFIMRRQKSETNISARCLLMKHLNITFEIFFRLKQFQFNGCKMRNNILVKELHYHLK